MNSVFESLVKNTSAKFIPVNILPCTHKYFKNTDYTDWTDKHRYFFLLCRENPFYLCYPCSIFSMQKDVGTR
jgi:hypothetical protein